MKNNIRKHYLLLVFLLSIIINTQAQTSSYCASVPLYTDAAKITNVQFGSLNNSSNCASTAPLNNVNISGYCDYTSVPTGTYYTGKSYLLNINTNSCYNFSVHTNYIVYAAYIDYNQDGDFTDSNENVLNTGMLTYNINSYADSTIINIPNNAKRGNTRLRVVISVNHSSTSLDCGTYWRG